MTVKPTRRRGRRGRRKRPRKRLDPEGVAREVWTLVDRHVPTHVQRLYRVQEQWAKVVGETVARHARPMAVDGDLLVVWVRNSQWMHEINYLREEIAGRMAAMTKGEIQRVDLRLRYRENAEPPPPVPEPPPPRPPRVAPPSLAPLAQDVRDPELRALLEST